MLRHVNSREMWPKWKHNKTYVVCMCVSYHQPSSQRRWGTCHLMKSGSPLNPRDGAPPNCRYTEKSKHWLNSTSPVLIVLAQAYIGDISRWCTMKRSDTKQWNVKLQCCHMNTQLHSLLNITSVFAAAVRLSKHSEVSVWVALTIPTIVMCRHLNVQPCTLLLCEETCSHYLEACVVALSL